MKKIFKLPPAEIEKKSFEIIDEELKKRELVPDEAVAHVVKRAIHTSADFEYAETLIFSDNAVKTARELIKGGADIVTDTNMAFSGINKKMLGRYGGKVYCFMADDDIAKRAQELGTTRAALCMEKAAKSDKPQIFAIGNAPTALIKLYEMMEAGIYTPAFVIGVPVGFVNVEASKELIIQSGVPYIVNRGRKGGSNIAAAIVNAILYSIRDEC